MQPCYTLANCLGLGHERHHLGALQSVHGNELDGAQLPGMTRWKKQLPPRQQKDAADQHHGAASRHGFGVQPFRVKCRENLQLGSPRRSYQFSVSVADVPARDSSTSSSEVRS